LAFEKKDAAVFFGRDDDIRSLIERLNVKRVQGGTRLVVLLGPSGSGKSSVLRAGVIPRLEHDRHNWIVLPPFRPGRDPPSEFARAGAEALDTPQDWRVWRERFLSPSGFQELAHFTDAARMRAGAREASLLVPIDQGEELFAVATPQDAEHMFNILDAVTAADAPIVVLMMLRSDYLGRLQSRMTRFDQISLGLFPLARVREIIEGPAGVGGFHVEEALIASAIADMGTDDALPLLAFTLRELHDRFVGPRGQRTAREIQLSLAHYRMLGDPTSGLNPLENAVRRRADEVVDSSRLSDKDLGALREAFIGAMVRIDDQGQYVRQPAPWDDLPVLAQPILEDLARARLVVIRTDAGVKTVEVAHEALLRKWPLLRTWLDAARDFLVGRAQLRYALDDWERAAATEKTAALLRGLRLIRAQQWLVDHARALTQNERRYIEQSIAQANAEERRRIWLRRVAQGSGAIFALFFVGFLFLAREQQFAKLRAEAAALAVQARSNLVTDPVRAAALAGRAVAMQSSVDTESVLLESILGLSPHLAKVLRIPQMQAGPVAWAQGDAVLAIGGEAGTILWWRPFDEKHSDAVSKVFNVPDGPKISESPIVGLSWDEGLLTGVSANGQWLRVDGSSQRIISAKSLPIQSAGKVSVGAGGKQILIAPTGERDISVFDCANAARESCVRRPITSGYASAVALESAHAAAAVGYDDGTLKIVSFSREPPEEVLKLIESERIVSLAWDRDGQQLAIGTVNGQTLVMDRKGNIIAKAPKSVGGISELAWDPSGRRFAATCKRVVICVWQLSPANGEESPLQLVSELKGHVDLIRGLAWTHDGRMIASDANDDTVRLWSVSDSDRSYFTRSAGNNVALTDLAISSDRRWLAAGDDRGDVHVWPLPELGQALTSPEVLIKGTQGDEIKALAWSPKKSALAVGDGTGRITVRNWPDRGPPDEAIAETPIEILQWLADGATLITAGTLDGAIVAHRLTADRSESFKDRHPEAVVGMALDPEGESLLSTDANGNVWLWDIATRTRSKTLPPSGKSRDTVSFSHDRLRALVAGNDGDVLVYTLKNNEEPVHCHSASQQLDGAAFSVDDKIIVAVSRDAILHLWSLSDQCALLASAPLLRPDGSTVGEVASSHRRHLIMVPELDTVGITLSTQNLLLVSINRRTWLARAKSFADLTE
jgi:WD40 repeat protein